MHSLQLLMQHLVSAGIGFLDWRRIHIPTFGKGRPCIAWINGLDRVHWPLDASYV